MLVPNIQTMVSYHFHSFMVINYNKLRILVQFAFHRIKRFLWIGILLEKNSFRNYPPNYKDNK